MAIPTVPKGTKYTLNPNPNPTILCIATLSNYSSRSTEREYPQVVNYFVNITCHIVIVVSDPNLPDYQDIW